ncbi:MAG: hypothetical protein DRO92_02065 [Candidatus Altiarchaeales archaeon]|nr:MAG: hypothetical protein DRO92_02065 [Candidatus Altiarchaeales archaeon]
MAERILDEKLEKEIREKIDKEIKTAMKEIEIAKSKISDKTEETIESIREKPVEWVVGAFVAGLIIGKLLSK